MENLISLLFLVPAPAERSTVGSLNSTKFGFFAIISNFAGHEGLSQAHRGGRGG